MYPTKKLGDLIKITKGKKVNYSDIKGKYNYIDIGILRSGIIKQFTNDEGIICTKDDILIAWDGSKSGTVGFGLEGVIGSTLAKFEILSENISTEFLGKFLQSQFNYLNKNTSGAAIPHLRKDILIGLNINIPPISTQKLIVKKLDESFEKIDLQISLIKNNLQNLKEIEKSVLEEVFKNGDFEMKKLGEITEIIGGGTPKTEELEYWGNDIIWLSPTDLPEIGKISIISDSAKKISFLGLSKSSAKLLPIGTVIFSSRATIGKIAINSTELSTNQGFANFVCSDKIYNFYLAYSLKNHTKQITLLSNSTTFKEVNKTNLRNFEIPLPPIGKQKEIVNYLDNFFEKQKLLKEKYEKNLQNLEDLKQSLLKDAFDGKLVKE